MRILKGFKRTLSFVLVLSIFAGMGWGSSTKSYAATATQYTFESIAGGYEFAVGLKTDGTVVSVGTNNVNQSNSVLTWTNIVQISTGIQSVTGLKSDGTVVMGGDIPQIYTSGWTSIVQVSAGSQHVVGLKSDGTVVAGGFNTYGQCDVNGWTNIIQIVAGNHFTLGLKADGTVVATGYNVNGECNVSGWTNIIQIAAGSNHSIGLYSNGTVVATGLNFYGQCNVGGLSNIKQVSGGESHTLALGTNGGVTSVGHTGSGQGNVSGWTNIVQISAGGYFNMGLKADGTVVAVGASSFGQLGCTSWTNIKTYNNVPTINVTTANNQTVLNSISLTGTVSDTDEGNIITTKYRIGNGATQIVEGTVTTSGAFTTTAVDTSALTAGNHTLSVWSEDNKGGVSAITTKNFIKLVEYYYDKYNIAMLWNEPYLEYAGTGYGSFNQYQGYTFNKSNNTFSPVGNAIVRNASEGAVGELAGYLVESSRLLRYYYHTGSMWKVYIQYTSNSTQSLQKSTLNTTNIKAFEGTYPVDGLHTDNYWYVRGAVVNDNPTITIATPTNGETFLGNISLTGSVIDNNVGNTLTTKYNIDGGVTQTVAGTVTTSGAFTPTSINVSALTLGVHTLNVWAVDNTGKQSNISSINFKVDEDTIIPQMDSVDITATSSTIDVRIAASDDNLPATPYTYIIDGQASESIASNSHTFSSLEANRKYTVEVQVRDAYGNISTYTEETYTKMQTPTISVSTILGNQLKLNLLDNNSATTQYQIMCNNMYINAIGQETATPIWMTLLEKSVILEGLELNTQYAIKVKARTKLGQETAFSEIVTAKIDVASLLDVEDLSDSFKVLSKTGREVQLSWSAPIDPAQIKKYELYRDGKLVETTKNTTFTDHNLDYATAYIYEIKAYDTSNNISDFGEPLSVITLDVDQVSKISSGQVHNLMLKSDGTVWAWGANTYGQLGNGTTESSNSPIKVKGLDHIINIFAGDEHNLALKSDGTVWAWGVNDYGQLGNGTLDDKHEPIQVKDIYDVISMSAGYAHSIFLTSDGTVWGCGINEEGELGDNTFISRKVPVKAVEIKNVKVIATGDRHNLAIKHDGTVWAWGANRSGQLGDSTLVDKNIPFQVTGLEDIVQVKGGKEHSLALKKDGTIWAWGYNEHGTLGDGTTIDRLEPVQVLGLENIIDLDAGNNHNIALKNDNTVWTWGFNSQGMLGNGSLNFSSIPVQAIGLSNVEQITAGGEYNFAITADQNVWSWGKNDYGQLGSENIGNITLPQLLEGFVIGTVFDSLTEVVSDTSLMINWSGGADTATYEMELNNTIITSTERNYLQVDGLQPKTAYTYRIRQVNSMGTTDWSESRSITTYALPTPYSYEGLIDETKIEIKWDAIKDATAYEIEVDGQVINVTPIEISGTPTDGTTPTTTIAPVQIYTHINLEQNTTHKYKVRAIGAEGTSSWSEEVPVTTLPVRPESPNDLKGFSTDTVVKLTWTAVGGVIGYDIELDSVMIENGTETTYEHTDLDPYTQHKYRIRSRSDLIEGNWSDFLTIFTLPGKPKAPEKITVSTVGKVSTINWESKQGSLRYEIEVDGTVYNVGNNTTYIHRGITLGKEHLYRVRSVNKIGTSEWSGFVVNNSIKAISTKKKDLELGLTASNITDFSQYELSVFYNKDVIKVKDLCAKTSVFELSPGFIEQEGITIKSFEPGKITFTVEKDIELGYDWTGIVNNIIFDGQVSGGTTIDYTVYIIPN
ncbi:MAG: hypothetical protein CVU84_12745 [Firmicutes bacterium HGW-Firmicutes-1]|jgi:alpha-tubulin suppressor-like RCC1 family protein|nr:MAG: hypothetical protein CVU84_12745 [Firmicutes bacterium HGW-Firmicutes-1]